jgi:hypothetical protein
VILRAVLHDPRYRSTPRSHPRAPSNDTGVTFKWKDYRLEGSDRYKTMTLAVGE